MIDSTDPPLRLTAVDDHPFLLNGIRWTVRDCAPWVQVIGPSDSALELVLELTTGSGAGRADEPVHRAAAAIDVVVLNLDRASAGADPAVDVRAIRRAGPQVLVVTGRDHPDPLLRAVAAGAAGLLRPSDPAGSLIHTLLTVRSGRPVVCDRLARALLTDRPWVTLLAPRFVRAFELLAAGQALADIGGRLDPPVAASTVQAYLHHGVGLYRSARPGRGTAAAPDRTARPAPAPLAAMGWDEMEADGIL